VLLDEVLGKGMSGEVKLAVNKVSQQRVAVKSLSMRNFSKQQRKTLVNEIAIHFSVDHPNIATLIDAYESEDTIELVTEYMEGGCLFSLRKNMTITEELVAETVKQMLLAANYIHNKSIVHRDIKPENFLLQKKPEAGEGVGTIKLIDFGVSKWIDPGKIMSSVNATGTRAYTAPEVLQHFYTDKCDIWSIGVVTFILLVDYMPFFGNPAQMAAMIMRGRPRDNGPKHRWDAISEDCKELLDLMFKTSPVDRISAEQALQHPWLRSHREQSEGSAVPLQYAQVGLQRFARASRFRRACMLITSWALTSEERSNLSGVFVELDTKGTGYVDVQSFLDKVNLPVDKQDQLSQVLDATCGGGFRYSDFLAAMACTSRSDSDIAQEVFRRFDVNQSGAIGVEELQVLFGESFDCDCFVAHFPASKMTVQDLEEYLHDPTSPTTLGMTDFSEYLKEPQPFLSPKKVPKLRTRSRQRLRECGA